MTHFGIRSKKIEGSNLEMKFSTLGEFPDTSAETDQVTSGYISCPSHYHLTVRTKKNNPHTHTFLLCSPLEIFMTNFQLSIHTHTHTHRDAFM